MLRRVAAFCRPLRPVLLLVSFPRSQSPVVAVPGLCWMWRDVPFARQWRPVVGVWRLCWLLWGSFDYCLRSADHVHLCQTGSTDYRPLFDGPTLAPFLHIVFERQHAPNAHQPIACGVRRVGLSPFFSVLACLARLFGPGGT